MAKFRFLGYLAEATGHRTKEVILEKPTRLREIFPMPFNEKNVIILIDEKVGNFDNLIENENSVIIMPILSGG